MNSMCATFFLFSLYELIITKTVCQLIMTEVQEAYCACPLQFEEPGKVVGMVVISQFANIQAACSYLLL